MSKLCGNDKAWGKRGLHCRSDAHVLGASARRQDYSTSADCRTKQNCDHPYTDYAMLNNVYGNYAGFAEVDASD